MFEETREGGFGIDVKRKNMYEGRVVIKGKRRNGLNGGANFI
jgi:hypothetical protein